jgi:hypothetical protein
MNNFMKKWIYKKDYYFIELHPKKLDGLWYIMKTTKIRVLFITYTKTKKDSKGYSFKTDAINYIKDNHNEKIR